jgi:hypothetical protein
VVSAPNERGFAPPYDRVAVVGFSDIFGKKKQGSAFPLPVSMPLTIPDNTPILSAPCPSDA